MLDLEFICILCLFLIIWLLIMFVFLNILEFYNVSTEFKDFVRILFFCGIKLLLFLLGLIFLCKLWVFFIHNYSKAARLAKYNNRKGMIRIVKIKINFLSEKSIRDAKDYFITLIRIIIEEFRLFKLVFWDSLCSILLFLFFWLLLFFVSGILESKKSSQELEEILKVFLNDIIMPLVRFHSYLRKKFYIVRYLFIIIVFVLFFVFLFWFFLVL